ncbi:MAG TPA: hypothetical protein VEQ34_11380, partial [Pyrinomonadaceae bacterium]|nr:hypothetical protein [Pyrinomonadaceae bacterium]
MRLARVLHVFAGLLISASITLGQTAAVPAPTASPEDEKSLQEIEKKALSLLERTIGDADSLRLPENRVYVFASSAALLWTRDEKRARQLFRRAANEISAIGSGTEENGDELPENFRMLQSARSQLLNLVSYCDVELALELLRQTRPPIYDRILSLSPEKIKLYRNLHHQAQNELNLEKEFALRLIKQNPRRALELARANLSKGASYSDLNLINQLRNTEPELATKFADEVLQKLLSTDFSDPNDYNARSLTQNFLSQFSATPNSEESKQFKIDKNALRRLAAKYADYFSGNALQQHSFRDIQNSLPIFERILPERVASLRQRYERLKQSYEAQNQYNQFQERFNQLNGSAAPETLIDEAENFPIEMRSQIYGSAANKMAQAGNYAAGRQLLVSLPGKQARQYALHQFDWQRLYKFLNEEKYAEAEQIIAQQTDRSQKIRLLIQTASYFSNKKQNEKADRYISEARSLINPNPENHVELTDLMQVLSADGNPEKMFDLVESFVPKFNEIFAATAFLSKYQPSYGNFREGELIISSGGGHYVLRSEMAMGGSSVNVNSMRLERLGKANLERAMNLADRFERSDVRTAA